MIIETIFFEFFNALIDGDSAKCKLVVNELIRQKTDIKYIYIDLLQKSMYKIGKWWEKGKITIAEEHVATQIVSSILTSTLEKIPKKESVNKLVILSCIDKEFHDLGIRMISNIFEINGWSTLYLGSNSPSNEIIKIIGRKKPQIVALSFSLYINLFRFVELIGKIKTSYPTQQLIIGGQGTFKVREEMLKMYQEVYYFDDIYKLDEFINL